MDSFRDISLDLSESSIVPDAVFLTAAETFKSSVTACRRRGGFVIDQRRHPGLRQGLHTSEYRFREDRKVF